MKNIFFVGLILALQTTQLNAAPLMRYVVKKGETLYAISRNHGLKLKDLLSANPKLSVNSNIKPGEVVLIPSTRTGLINSDLPERAFVKSTSNRQRHVAVPSTPETPYRDEDGKIAGNKCVPNNDVAMNSGLAQAVATNAENSSHQSLSKTNACAVRLNQYPGRTSINRGEANYFQDNNANNTFQALYNGAETGSMIKVTNLMTHKTVYVKVTGKVPGSDSNKEIMLKLSRNAAEELGASEAKFLVEVTRTTE